MPPPERIIHPGKGNGRILYMVNIIAANTKYCVNGEFTKSHSALWKSRENDLAAIARAYLHAAAKLPLPSPTSPNNRRNCAEPFGAEPPRFPFPINATSPNDGDAKVTRF
jgi:hypothetical protein